MAIEFRTFDEILDFAIGQERAAQVFYTNLAAETADPEKSRYYRDLAAQEQGHEEKLVGLRLAQLHMPTPDLEDLRQCGYLDALPLTPEMKWEQVLKYLIKKEKSAKMLYTVLANSAVKQEHADLFTFLAAQEAAHAEYFQHEYDACLNADG